MHLRALIAILSAFSIVYLPAGRSCAATPPAAVKNLTAWYDASDSTTLTVATQNVTQWTDKSSKGENLAQSTASLEPTYTPAGINGLGSLTFNGAQQLVSNDSAFSRFLYPTSTVFIVQNSASDSQNASSLWSGSSTTQRINFGLPSNGSCLYSGAPVGNNAVCLWFDFGDSQLSRIGAPVSSYTTIGTHLFMGSGQAGTSELFRRDGTSVNSQTPDVDTAFSCALVVGSRGGCSANDSYFSGSIGEIVVYNTVLSAANYQLVEGFLACKWGIQSQLPATHPYATSCPSGTESSSLGAISGLSAWFDASDISTVASGLNSVSQVNDKSGKGNTLTQATTAAKPSLITTGGLQALMFNGSQYLATSTSNTLATGASPSSMFIVGAFTGTTTATVADIIAYGSVNSGLARSLVKNSGNAKVVASEENADVISTSPWASTPTLAFAQFGATTESLAVGGASATSGSYTPATSASTPLYLGNNSASNAWTGPIYEAIVYNAALSTNEQQFIEGYLACKWGVQANLPASHPYKSSCPSTATAGLTLTLAVSPTSPQVPGTDLRYTTTFTNGSGTLVYGPVLTSPVPANTWFKVGTATQSIGGTGLTATITYSNDSGSTYTYTPVSGGGSAASGYDAKVTNVRWTLSGALGPAPTINSGNASFTARII